jgi:adenine C2-methylase RlmN of 23S rRNA A2503 and tRNA A37
VSTVGIATRLEQFVAEFPQVNLAVSLHAGIDELRSKLVPANKAYPLKALAAALQRCLELARKKIFLEYVLIGRLNDGPVHARELARFVRSVGRPDLLHVNLILLNPTNKRHQPPPEWVIKTFRNELVRLGLHVTIRKSLGAEIEAACGQLATGGNRKRPGGGGFRALS